MRNVLGYSDGFGDLCVTGAVALLLVGGLQLCYHLLIERPARARRQAREAR